jgi:LEA14-like dessication related protein
MNRIVAAALLIVAGGILTGGCASLSRDGGVAVSLVSIRPVQTSLFETSAELTLRFTNESSRPVALAGSTHRLFVNGSYVGRATTHEQLTIPHLGTTTQTLTAHLENLALMRKAQEMGNASVVGYRIDSRLHGMEDKGGGTLAATSTGELDLGGLMPGQLAPRGQ